MKISAKQITKGMKIQLSDIANCKNLYLEFIKEDYYSESQKNYYKKCIEENKILKVKNGSVKKDSTIYTVLDIHTGSSDKTYHNSRLVVNNDIWLITDNGNILISTKQKVELV